MLELTKENAKVVDVTKEWCARQVEALCSHWPEGSSQKMELFNLANRLRNPHAYIAHQLHYELERVLSGTLSSNG